MLRPINADSIIVDYSLQSIGNSDTRYLAGVIRPSITSGSIAGVDLASRDVSFIPISGILILFLIGSINSFFVRVIQMEFHNILRVKPL